MHLLIYSCQIFRLWLACVIIEEAQREVFCKYFRNSGESRLLFIIYELRLKNVNHVYEYIYILSTLFIPLKRISLCFLLMGRLFLNIVCHMSRWVISQVSSTRKQHLTISNHISPKASVCFCFSYKVLPGVEKKAYLHSRRRLHFLFISQRTGVSLSKGHGSYHPWGLTCHVHLRR